MAYVLIVIKVVVLAFILSRVSNYCRIKMFSRKIESSEPFLKEIPEIKTYKHLLGIKNDFDSAILKKAYRKQVKANHPDLFINRTEKIKATQKMLKINEAYQFLSEYLQIQNGLQA